MSSNPVEVDDVFSDCHGLPCLGTETIPAGKTIAVLPIGGTDRNTGLIHIKGPSEGLSFNLRIRDLSRQSETWGTEIPVVRQSDARTTKIALLNVPVGAKFRHTLRIYDFDGRSDAEVRLRIYEILSSEEQANQQPDRLLAERAVTLRAPIPGDGERSPGYLEIGDLSQIGPLGNTGYIAVEIEPLTPGLRYWAFISVTHNTTQHVTTISP